MNKLTRILAIDGGGIRGIIPGQVLVALEQILKDKTGDENVRVTDYFDLIAGTSTGGILACIYLRPDEADPGRPKFSASDAVNFYMEKGPEIFKATIAKKISSVNGFLDEKYCAKSLEENLKEYFGYLRLSELVKPCLIPAYDIEKRCALFFNQRSAKESRDEDFHVMEVTRATAAAPSFFEVAEVHSLTGREYHLVDGGVFANNPALCAYAEARKLEKRPTVEEMVILSLGCGQVDKPYEYEKVKDWGAAEWVPPLVEIMMSGVSETIDYQLRMIFNSIDKREQYLRIDPELDCKNTSLAEMDNASDENLQALKEIGEYTAHKYYKELERMADILIEND